MCTPRAPLILLGLRSRATIERLRASQAHLQLYYTKGGLTPESARSSRMQAQRLAVVHNTYTGLVAAPLLCPQLSSTAEVLCTAEIRKEQRTSRRGCFGTRVEPLFLMQVPGQTRNSVYIESIFKRRLVQMTPASACLNTDID